MNNDQPEIQPAIIEKNSDQNEQNATEEKPPEDVNLVKIVNDNQPKKQKILQITGLIDLYQPFRENTCGISPQEIAFLPRMPYLKGVDKDLGGNLYSCFKRISNYPTLMDLSDQNQKTSKKRVKEESSPYPRSRDINSTSVAYGTSLPGKRSKRVQAGTPTQKGTRTKQRAMSPPKLVRFISPLTPSFRSYQPWSEIISSDKSRRPPFKTPTMTVEDAQDTIVSTFKEIRATSADREPDVALNALKENPALVLSLGLPYPVTNEQTAHERYELKDTDKYCITLLPVDRRQSIPKHRIMRKIYTNARLDHFMTHQTIQLLMNRVHLSERYYKSFSITPFVRVSRFLWPVRKGNKAQTKTKHKRQTIMGDVSEYSVDLNKTMNVMAEMSTGTFAVKTEAAAKALNIVFDNPFVTDYFKLKKYFEKRNDF